MSILHQAQRAAESSNTAKLAKLAMLSSAADSYRRYEETEDERYLDEAIAAEVPLGFLCDGEVTDVEQP